MKITDTKEFKEIAKNNIVLAAHEFFIVSPRYCELKDKQNSELFMNIDELQELRWLEVLSLNLNLYLGEDPKLAVLDQSI